MQIMHERKECDSDKRLHYCHNDIAIFDHVSSQPGTNRIRVPKTSTFFHEKSLHSQKLLNGVI